MGHQSANGSENPTTSHESHPYNHLGLGELCYLILARYPRGGKDRTQVVQLLREHSCKNSCTVNHLSGEFDLAIWVWVPAGKLDDILGLIKSALSGAKTVVYPIQRVTTPLQRYQDIPGVAPKLFDRHFDMKSGVWTPHRSSSGNRSADLAAKLKFYTVIATRPGDSRRLFESLCERFAKRSDSDFEHYVCATYRAETEEGCVISAYTTSWQRNELALLHLLDELPEGAHPTTYLCFNAHLDNDLPWIESRSAANAPSIDTLKTRAMRAITGTNTLRDRDDRNVVPHIEALFTDPNMARSILTYDPEYWWDYVADVKDLVEDVVIGSGDEFISILLRRYVSLDRKLCDAVRKLFALPKSRKRQDDEDRALDGLILSGLKNVKYEVHAGMLTEALELIRSLRGIEEKDRRLLLPLIGQSQKYLNRLSEKEAHLNMGAVAEIVSKLHREGVVPKRFLHFSENGLMDGWEDNLNAIARDRDLLAHGQVQSAFDLDDVDKMFWQRLLPNYIRAYPQVRYLLCELRRAYEEKCRQHPIRLPLRQRSPRSRKPRFPSQKRAQQNPGKQKGSG